MNKVSFLARWTFVFSVLSIFSFYALTALVGHNPEKAYAATVSNSGYLNASSQFVVLEDQNRAVAGIGPRTKKICAIDQVQLDALRTDFDAAVTTIDVGGEEKNFAVAEKMPGTTNPQIYSTIGIDVHGPKCQIVKLSNTFLLILQPGVS